MRDVLEFFLAACVTHGVAVAVGYGVGVARANRRWDRATARLQGTLDRDADRASAAIRSLRCYDCGKPIAECQCTSGARDLG